MSVTPATPFPLNWAVCGLFDALSLTVNVPLRVPDAEGVNVTEIVQLAREAKVFGDKGQFDVCPKSPEVEIVLMLSALVPAFFSVTVFAALVVEIVWLENVRLAGDNVTGRTPDPVREATWGDPEALSVTVSVPVRLPDTVGVKVTEIVHLVPAASVLGDSGQVEVSP